MNQKKTKEFYDALQLWLQDADKDPRKLKALDLSISRWIGLIRPGEKMQVDLRLIGNESVLRNCMTTLRNIGYNMTLTFGDEYAEIERRKGNDRG